MALVPLRILLDHAPNMATAWEPSTSITWNRSSRSWKQRPRPDSPVIVQASRGARSYSQDAYCAT